jgi:hypothetical protein
MAPYIKNGTVLFPRSGCEELLGQMLNLGVESHDVNATALLVFHSGLGEPGFGAAEDSMAWGVTISGFALPVFSVAFANEYFPCTICTFPAMNNPCRASSNTSGKKPSSPTLWRTLRFSEAEDEDSNELRVSIMRS